MATDKKRKVTIESTGWISLEIEAVSNYSDDIKIDEYNKYNDEEKCYTKKVVLTMPAKEAKRVQGLINHIQGGCGGDCFFCKET